MRILVVMELNFEERTITNMYKYMNDEYKIPTPAGVDVKQGDD
jgi:hypothetical protein